MQTGIRLALVVLVMLGVAVGRVSHAETNGVASGESIMRQAYLTVVQAEIARAEQRVPDAVKAYKEAVALYGRLQVEYPGWHEDMVGYRLADCNQAIALLDPLGGVPGSVAMLPDVSGGTSTNAMLRLSVLMQELEDAKGWLVEEGAGDKRQKNVERDMEQMRTERDQALKQVKLANRQASKLEARLKRYEKTNAATQTNTYVYLPGTIRTDAVRMIQEGQYDKAMGLLREGFEVMPDRQDFEVLAGVAACRAGKFDQAVAILKPYDTKNPVNADALLTLGTAWMGMGKIGEARVAIEKALLLNPKSMEANYNMAQIFLTIRPADPQSAERYYRKAMELGMEPDAEFENGLRSALIISRLRTKSGK